MKIVFLYSELMPYMCAVINYLSESNDLFVVSWSKKTLTPFRPQLNDSVIYYSRDYFDSISLYSTLNIFDPEIIYVSGRMDACYLKVSKKFRGRAIIVAGIDTQLDKSLKSLFKIMLSKYLYKQYFDYLWVPGLNQYYTARKLGYQDNRIIKWLYSGDSDLFFNHFKENHSLLNRKSKKLVFVGRLEIEKGFDLLLKVWTSLTKEEKNGYTLAIFGDGSLRQTIPEDLSIKFYGFLGQDKIRNEINHGDVFVLPSRYEPWGVVVHEMAMSGLILLCSNKVGASSDLLINGYNGYSFDSNSFDSLKKVICKTLMFEESKIFEMASNSRFLSTNISTSLSANSLISIKHL